MPILNVNRLLSSVIADGVNEAQRKEFFLKYRSTAALGF